MKKLLLVCILIAAAAIAVHQGSKRVKEHLPPTRPERPEFPEDLPEELRAQPIAKIRQDQPTRFVHACNDWVACFGNEASFEMIEILPSSLWGRKKVEVSLPGVPTAIQGSGETLRVFFEEENPIFFDLSTPSDPVAKEIRNLPSELKGLIFEEDLAVGFSREQIRILTIDSEGVASEEGVYPTVSGGMSPGFIRNAKLHFCDGWAGFHTVDLTLPFSPNFESLFPFDDAVVDACVVNDHLLICLQGRNAQVHPWPLHHKEDRILELDQKAKNCVLHGDRVFLGYSTWTREYDFSDPESPVLLKVYPDHGGYLSAWENHLLIPKGEKGVWIYRLEPT